MQGCPYNGPAVATEVQSDKAVHACASWCLQQQQAIGCGGMLERKQCVTNHT